jgi:hypothetical protein
LTLSLKAQETHLNLFVTFAGIDGSSKKGFLARTTLLVIDPENMANPDL